MLKWPFCEKVAKLHLEVTEESSKNSWLVWG